VGRLSPDGQHYNGAWITGLNAPKGMGRYGHRLYVADISEVVVIDDQASKTLYVPGFFGKTVAAYRLVTP